MTNEHLELRVRPASSTDSAPPRGPSNRLAALPAWQRYTATAFVLTACTLLSWVSHVWGLTDANIVMLLLAGVVLVAACFGRGPAITMAILGVLVFDFFFVSPAFAFAPTDTEYFVTLAVMLGVGLLISELTARIQKQLQASQEQERRTAQLYQMSQELSTVAGTQSPIHTAGVLLTEVFSGVVVLFTCEADGSLRASFESSRDPAPQPELLSAAEWVAAHGRAAGFATGSLSEVPAILLPMVGSQRMVGVLSVAPRDPERFLDREERRLLETCANLAAIAIERTQSVHEAQQAQIQVEQEQLRNSLLSAVSHDLRTPLAMLEVTATSLLEGATSSAGQPGGELLETMVDESRRLSRQVDNLLDMARLESGDLKLNRDWQVLEELIGVVIARFRRELQGRPVQIRVAADFPLIWVAGDLIEHMLINLLENTLRYSPPGSPIEIRAEHHGAEVQICVADRGPGLPPGSESKVFDKFYRANAVVADGQRGVGLGLTICQAIARAHGGSIRAANRPQGGAEFVVSLPFSQPDPPLKLDDLPVLAGS